MFEAEIAAGIAWLDIVQPDWRDKITRPLMMHTTGQCVLGQVFTLYGKEGFITRYGFNRAIKIAGLGKDIGDWLPWADAHGFAVDPFRVPGYTWRAWDTLKDEWVATLAIQTETRER